MIYCLSNMADLVDEYMTGTDPVLAYEEKTSGIVKNTPLGIELTELCNSSNLWGEAYSTSVSKMKRDAGSGSVAVVHGPYNELFPAAIDPDAAQFAFDRYKIAVNTAFSLGIEKVVIHSGFVPNIYFPSWFTEKSIVFWKRFLDEVPGDYRIVLENVMDSVPDDMLKIAEAIDDKRFSLCLDIGHANVKSEIPVSQWIDAWKDKLSHYHIHNNDGVRDLHNLPGDGVMDVAEILRYAEKLTPDATATLEVMDAESGKKWLSENGFIK